MIRISRGLRWTHSARGAHLSYIGLLGGTVHLRRQHW
jgi:hypothetical protein